MLGTVSVSTVMVCLDVSGFGLACLDDMLECLVRRGGGTDAVLLDSTLALLSLPLSCGGKLGLARKVRLTS